MRMRFVKMNYVDYISARKIQSAVRMWFVKSHYIDYVSARKIQTCFRRWSIESLYCEFVAARLIQSWYRGYDVRRMYKDYRSAKTIQTFVPCRQQLRQYTLYKSAKQYNEHNHQKLKKQRLETYTKMDMDNDDNFVEGKQISETKLQIAYAAHYICQFFYERGEFDQMKQWWDWSGLFRLLKLTPDRITCHSKNADEYLEAVEFLRKSTSDEQNLQQTSYNIALATKWHAARAVSNLMNIRNLHRVTYLQNLGLENEVVPWIPHPWKLLDEEELFQKNQLN